MRFGGEEMELGGFKWRDRLMGFGPLTKSPVPNSKFDVFNIKTIRRHRSEFNKNSLETGYDDLQKKIYFGQKSVSAMLYSK